MSPTEFARNSARRLLAEEHIAYALVLSLVLICATVYAIYTKDHSANVWAVYVGVVTGIMGLLTGRKAPASRSTDASE